MLFNSFSFAIFLPIVYLLYWYLSPRKLSTQNLLLLVASYFFYACWDWRFLFLLLFSTLLDFFSGIKIHQTKRKKLWLWISIIINVGLLGVFKYYNFFTESFVQALSEFGFKVNPMTINVILPVGISFYTFHGVSYVVDVYKGRIEPEKNFSNYALFVSFFPLLVAGPIERATHLLPQIKKTRVLNYEQSIDGLKQILWGLFKKIVIADNCAVLVNEVFSSPQAHTGSDLAVAAVLFAFQIYCDFSGYSDIALGTARLFGIELLKNFSYPYFSRDIAEFWRRWHISLSSWFKDYVYIPLGGSKQGIGMKIRNTFIIFLLSGFWHGANWTFIVWGALNAIYFLPLLLTNSNRNNLDIVAKGRRFPSLRELTGMLVTFGLTVLAWVFFRAENVGDAFSYLYHMFSYSLFAIPTISAGKIAILIVFFVWIEWLGREENFAIKTIGSNWNSKWRYIFYHIIAISIFCFAGKEQQFIYFEF
ncbi:MBOAT family O-acyltransferase [Chryseobacterium herbae]|uniref:MBOAT family protein n=1 Tax=Chryseobacterium herbae TaxID=2976476 RepID=A0ABT2IZ44_9FLAO|nr:MBOAT family O-acyltransferase [Chryseobacterium sp. pc1-10]MCT2564062.1 MBOAT family protein [Chryseobacterium sp. pc1-10]